MKTEHGIYVEATCEKVSALVAIYTHGIQVVCQNASHRVWKKSGKHFATIQDAIDNYRSGEMKEIIQAAVDFSKDVTPATLN